MEERKSKNMKLVTAALLAFACVACGFTAFAQGVGFPMSDHPYHLGGSGREALAVSAASLSSIGLDPGQILLSSMRTVDPDKPMVALTFDDGPHSTVTGRILDTLKEHDARATFFVVGNRINNYPYVTRRIADEGHELGDHSYSHTNFTELEMDQIKKEINDTQYIVNYMSGSMPVLIRVPYGAIDDKVKESVNMPLIQWSMDTLDWKTRNAEKTIEKVLEEVKDGDIILMHDLYAATADACEVIIPELVARGFQLVTVSELHEAREKAMEAGAVYHNLPLEILDSE